MNTSASYPEWLDIEVSTLSFMLDNGQWMAHEVAQIQRQLEDRKAQIIGGLGNPTQQYWSFRLQEELDECCRIRLDPVLGWMLDRWIEDLKCWHPVGYIGTGGRLENGNVVDGRVRPDLIEFLRAHDMQRPGYLEEKAAKALAIRLENERLAGEKVLMAVDSLSSKQIKEFVEVERAIQTGDTVTMHGETQRQFERMTEAGKKALPGPTSINPGVHPLRHRRSYVKGKHVRNKGS